MKEINSKEKSVLITGGTSGLGLELVKLFLKNNYNVVATGRQFIELSGFEDSFKLIQVDFNDMNKISDALYDILASYRLDIVINNAGVLSPPDYRLTTNGLEYSFQVNFLSHLLINEIILRKTGKADAIKIATVTSPVYRLADSDLTIHNNPDNYRAVRAYSSSKLYLTLMCEMLQSKFPDTDLHCFSFDPGTFSSGVYRMQKSWFSFLYRIAAPFMRSPEKVAEILFLLLTDAETENGMIYDLRKSVSPVRVVDKRKKEEFRLLCYGLTDPYIRQSD